MEGNNFAAYVPQMGWLAFIGGQWYRLEAVA